MPKKFKIDKRTSHLSSLIISGQITREEAMKELEKPLYAHLSFTEELQIILEKLNFTEAEFSKIMSETPKHHFDYPNSFFNNFGSFARKLRKYLSD